MTDRFARESRTFRAHAATAVATLLAGCATSDVSSVAKKSTASNYRGVNGSLDTVNLVTAPLAEDVQAAGRTSSNLSRDLEKSLKSRAPGESKQYGVRLRDLIGRGEIDANVELLPGDVIITPQSWF